MLAVYCLSSACGAKGDLTLKSYEKPSPSSGLKAIHRESEIVLIWEFPKDKEPLIKGFYVMKSTGGDFEKTAFFGSDKRSYKDTDFETGREYRYKVLTESPRGVTSNDSNIVTIKPRKVPSPPVNISFNIEDELLTLKWKAAGEGILYNIYKRDEAEIYPLTPLNREPLKETFFKDTFNVKKSVYYTVRSLAGGEIRDEGPASEEITIIPPEFVPSDPEGLQAVVTKENVHLIWKEPPETWITGYRIYREISTEDGFILIGESQAPSFLDRESPLTKRNYRVTALGPSKEGPPAEIRDVEYRKPR